MARRIAAVTPSTPLWTSLESAVRLTLTSLSTPSASASAFEDLEGEQSRIRRSGRHWLIG